MAFDQLEKYQSFVQKPVEPFLCSNSHQPILHEADIARNTTIDGFL